MESKDFFELMKRFDESSLAELSLEKGDFKVNLKKPCAFVQAARSADIEPAASGKAKAGQGPAGTREAAPAEDHERIISPLVATFYRAPAPDAPPFVEAGKRVKKGDTLCVLEAMKVMNRFESEYDCEITAILAENGKLVEYGQALFEVKRV